MTLNVVVLPAPLGPMSPVIWPSRADRLTSVTALMPPNLTDTSTISRTAWGSRRPDCPVDRTDSVAGADKGAALLFHEHGRRSACGGARRDERRFRRHAEDVAHVGAQVGDPAADAVGIPADRDGGDAGQQELVVEHVR